MGVDVSIEHDGRPVRLGERVEATVVVTSVAERDIDAVTLELEGRAHVWTNDSTEATQVFAAKKWLAGETHLTAGERRYRATFTLPSAAPPSANAGDLTIAYELRARVEIPWRIDPRATRAVTVLPPLPEPRGEPCRATVTSKASEGEPFLELTLDDTRWAPGETITGAFSIGNVYARRLDGATVAVVPLKDAVALAIPGGCSVFKSLADRGEGSVIHFALRLPKETSPSFECGFGKVIRAVALRVDGSSAACVIPIVIDAFEPRAAIANESGETIGASHWRRAWREEGARLGLSLARAELELSGELAGGAVEITVEPHGNGLRAKLRWDGLGIGLVVGPWSLTNLGGVDLEKVSAAFAKRFDARGRDETQVRAVLDADLCELLAAFDHVQLDDDGAVLGREVPARDQAALERFLNTVDRIASAIVAAADRIPPPSWVDAESASAWRAFAEATAGRLRTGPMSVRGAIMDGDRVHVRTLLDADGKPRATRVVLVLDPEVTVREPPALPEELRRALQGLTTDAASRQPKRFDVKADVMTLELGGFLSDPRRLAPMVAEMQRLARILRGETSRGPYR